MFLTTAVLGPAHFCPAKRCLAANISSLAPGDAGGQDCDYGQDEYLHFDDLQ